MRRLSALALAVCGLVALSPATRAELMSKRYDFRPGVLIEIGAETAPGVRLDSVKFQLPASVDGRIVRTSGPVLVRVAVSNVTLEPQRVGLAIALYDDAGRLLGVASGGSQVAPIRAGRQKTYELLFDGVNAEAERATAFQISLEPKP